jgi:hypothetical protein
LASHLVISLITSISAAQFRRVSSLGAFLTNAATLAMFSVVLILATPAIISCFVPACDSRNLRHNPGCNSGHQVVDLGEFPAQDKQTEGRWRNILAQIVDSLFEGTVLDPSTYRNSKENAL